MPIVSCGASTSDTTVSSSGDDPQYPDGPASGYSALMVT
jgi:hypothetical protein